MSRLHLERHELARIGWLRAAILGANDGIVSTACLILGVASAGVAREAAFVAGLAGLVAGAMSMAAGEFVSVSSQSDAERADLARERRELSEDPQAERDELAAIYRARGLSPELALKVADELSQGDALKHHARDELGITDFSAARPLQAALASAAAFAVGAALPLAALSLSADAQIEWVQVVAALTALAALGAAGARVAKAPMVRPVVRVVFWGALAMAVTAGIGRLTGAVL